MAEQIERARVGERLRGSRRSSRSYWPSGPDAPAEAVGLAEEAARGRADILTMDTLAWAYFKNGQLPEAQRAAAQAMRTGTRNARILCHADVIAAARSAPRCRYFVAWTRRHSSLP